MTKILIEYIYLILIILFLVMLARKLRVSYPIVLVLGGLLLSFTNGFSHIRVDPELIFFIFLPPLLYEAAWQTSWKQFWKWRRVIMSFAFIIVILTSIVVAFVSSAFIPGFTLPLGFLLGGIVSPPDAISATSVMRNVRVPKSLVSIIEGESLLNDASSLIIFRFALAAVTTGRFVLGEASLSFLLVIVMGTLIGVTIGAIFYAIHRWLPTTPSMDIVLSFVAPYCMYYFAERYHFSGVLAVVSGGLLLSSQRQTMLTHLSRVQGASVWSTVGFVLNGFVFMLIGLQLPFIVPELEPGLITAAGYGLLISGVLIVTRLLSTMGASLFTRFISRFITTADSNPGMKAPIIAGWAGMRGVVSLAAALSIPVYISTDVLFPQRNLILFITFIVILVTLVFQGLTLPWVIRKINLEDRYTVIPLAEQEKILRRKIAQASLAFLQKNYADELGSNDHLLNLSQRLEIDLRDFANTADTDQHNHNNGIETHQSIALDLLEEQRRLLHLINKKAEFDEDIIRKHLNILDLEETKLKQKYSFFPE